MLAAHRKRSVSADWHTTTQWNDSRAERCLQRFGLLCIRDASVAAHKSWLLLAYFIRTSPALKLSFSCSVIRNLRLCRCRVAT